MTGKPSNGLPRGLSDLNTESFEIPAVTGNEDAGKLGPGTVTLGIRNLIRGV